MAFTAAEKAKILETLFDSPDGDTARDVIRRLMDGEGDYVRTVQSGCMRLDMTAGGTPGYGGAAAFFVPMDFVGAVAVTALEARVSWNGTTTTPLGRFCYFLGSQVPHYITDAAALTDGSNVIPLTDTAIPAGAILSYMAIGDAAGVYFAGASLDVMATA